MALRLISYCEKTHIAEIGAYGVGVIKVRDVTKVQAEDLATKLARYYHNTDKQRGTPAGIFLTR